MYSEPDEVTLRDLADRFELAVREIEAELMNACPDASTPTDAFRHLSRRARDLGRRQHRFYSGRRAKFHGIGAFFVSTAGVTLNLDWSVDGHGALVWSGWDLKNFARSIGQPIDDAQTDVILERFKAAGAEPVDGRLRTYRLP